MIIHGGAPESKASHYTGMATGTFLRACRARLDPARFGFTASRRRTPGLRREEVAQLAGVSATWYTWLEQGRGGSPSSDALDRIASALQLTAVEREHLFLLAQNRPPEVRYESPSAITPQLQRVLDSMEFSPAIIKNATWDVLAWNNAALTVLVDYRNVPSHERNVLRLLFSNTSAHAGTPERATYQRLAVAAFRTEVTRMGLRNEVAAFIDDLQQTSPEFAALWSENEVREHGEGSKQIATPAGMLGLEYASFAVQERPDLTMLVFTPATADDANRLRQILA